MAGVVKAITESDLSAWGSAMKVEDFNGLTTEERSRSVSPYFCCLQDVLYGFALMTFDEPIPVRMRVIGDQNDENEELAKKLLRSLRRSAIMPRYRGTPQASFQNLSDELEFANSRQTLGLQAADLLVYEMVKELRNQDSRPEDRMRWPLDQILGDPESPQRNGLIFYTAAMLKAQVTGQWAQQGASVVSKDLDQTLRILRGKSEPFKQRLQGSERDE
jgi:hypothetical protein